MRAIIIFQVYCLGHTYVNFWERRPSASRALADLPFFSIYLKGRPFTHSTVISCVPPNVTHFSNSPVIIVFVSIGHLFQSNLNKNEENHTVGFIPNVKYKNEVCMIVDCDDLKKSLLFYAIKPIC